MSNKFVLEFEEKHHILEVDGIEYEIPQRTPELEELIKLHDEDVSNNTEYDNNMKMLEILFGQQNAHQMFPDKDKTNLDKLSKCAKIALSAYYSSLNSVKDEELANTMKEIRPIINEIDKVTKNINHINQAKFVNKNKKKRKK